MTKTLKIDNLTFEHFISREMVETSIFDLSTMISNDYAECTEPPILLITLKGAMLFASDLIKALTIESHWEFIKCSSYDGLTSTGCLQLTIPPTVSLQGRDIIVLEDIIDTGKTWQFLHTYCLDNGARSVKIATMLFKPDAYKGSLAIDYVALEIENKFIVGYGLDYNEQGRNLDAIYQLSESSK